MRILSLQPSVSLILESLGRLDSLVGCTKYCLDVVPELRSRSLPIVRDSWSSDTGEILALHPDLVIASVPYRHESLAAILKAGFPVLALAPHCLADIYADIRLIGSLVDAREAADEAVARMQHAIAEVSAIASQSIRRPLVYCEEWGKPLIHSQPWVRELVEAAGGEFLGEPGRITEATVIADGNPDVIVFAWCGAGDRVPVQRMILQRGWERLKAAQNKQAVCIPDELLNTPAPTLVGGLLALATVMHPGLFGAQGTTP